MVEGVREMRVRGYCTGGFMRVWEYGEGSMVVRECGAPDYGKETGERVREQGWGEGGTCCVRGWCDW